MYKNDSLVYYSGWNSLSRLQYWYWTWVFSRYFEQSLKIHERGTVFGVLYPQSFQDLSVHCDEELFTPKERKYLGTHPGGLL